MKKEKIAIIGIGMIVPKAFGKDEFWQNVLDGRNCITEVPKDHWDSALYYSPDRRAEDKTYTKIGGFIEGFQFNSLKYRIPPVTAKNISRLQQMTIEAVHEAMQDAGYDKKPFRTERTAAIFGNSLGPIQKDKNDFRVYRFKTADMLKKCPSFEGLPLALQDKIISEYFCKTGEIAAPINGDTLPGELSNVIAGRIANVFNLNGPNFAADAACASSLAALDYAVSGLREHKFDAAITGGADDMVQPTAFVRFSKMGALSADGSFAFDERANGFVLAEAVSVYILKRLSDAERDGDKIYALIDAIGSSSDGKGKGIAAPNPKGQKLAIEHAFSQVEYTPGDIDFIEAHGTATKVGDAAEAQVLDEVFSPFLQDGKKIGLTSVKSQIGHSKSAAGAVSVAKTALALSKKVLPGSINCVKENPAINLEKFYVIKESSEWKKEEGLRRAAVSSFGFGGTNFHVLMEEYAGKEQDHFVGKEEPGPEGYFSPAMVKEDPCVPFDKLQPEAITIWGDTPADVIRAAQREAKEVFSRMPAQYPLAVYAQQSMIRPQKKFGVSIVAKSAHDFCDKAEILAKKANPEQWEAPLTQFKLKQIYPFITKQNKAKVGLLFPGQGSQSVNMLRDLAAKYRVVKETFDEADAIMMRMIGVKLTEAIWSKPGEDKAALQRREDAIRQTKLTQPAMMTADIAMYRLISEYGIKPDMAIGHSLGEYAAATAAGVFTFENGLRAVTDRAKEMSNINVADVGKMAFVAMGCDKVDAELAKLNSGYVVSANKNCPTQTVIAGETKAVIDAIAHFKAMGIEAGEIAVSHAFHSAIMAPAMDPYRSFLQKIPINLPSLPILSNVTSDFYPNDKQGIYDILVQQIASPVEFIKQLEHMYDLGVRTFIECGPKRVLTGFATATLKDKNDVTILASNHPKRG
ncbi:MAG: type I polyketide synthase, partial [Elusimicrobiales bacterium]|nr:type I polyketide synthase [Elusimicrobiales bacterium]